VGEGDQGGQHLGGLSATAIAFDWREFVMPAEAGIQCFILIAYQYLIPGFRLPPE
jgi:hypothetical protein